MIKQPIWKRYVNYGLLFGFIATVVAGMGEKENLLVLQYYGLDASYVFYDVAHWTVYFVQTGKTLLCLGIICFGLYKIIQKMKIT